jgi:serine/threonine protein kinase
MTTHKKIGRYKIIRELGKPGLSEVYLAHDPSANREVVIKGLREQDQDNAEFRERLKREAQILGKLENAPIVPIYDFVEHRTRSYIVMRYMPGGTLNDLIKRESLSLEDIIPIVNRVSEGLDAAHAKGIVHRDLKPNNILFDEDGAAFLSDFGLAKQLDASKPITQSVAQIGTPLYMSPEHVVDARHVDSRSDIFSLGVILYEMLTRRHPYEDTSSLHKVFETIVHGEVPHLNAAELAKLQLPPKCNHILAKSLAKDCADRYATAGDMANDVACLLDSAASAEFKQPPVDASIVRRASFWLANQLDARVCGGVANRNQFEHMFVCSRILIVVISFILSTLAGGLLLAEYSRLTTSPSPTSTATPTAAVMTKTLQATATECVKHS